jgi:putative tricarboxylic transport membrane protein
MKMLRLAGIVASLVGFLALGIASTFHVRFLTDPVGPRGLPILAGILIMAAGISLAARPLLTRPLPMVEPEGSNEPGGERGPDEVPESGGAVVEDGRSETLRPLLLAATLAVYAMILPPVGFPLATTGALWATGRLFGGRSLPALLMGGGLSIALWFLFVGALGIALPVGWLWTAVR